MSSHPKIDFDKFKQDARQEFLAAAGGLPRSSKRYKKINGKMKRRLLWDFFKSNYVTNSMLAAKTVYSGQEQGMTLGEMIELMTDSNPNNNVHSIEHVVPKSTHLKNAMERAGGWDTQEINGATVNPLNMLPCHSAVNSERSELFFDFDGFSVKSKTLARVDGERRRFEAGKDESDEWVPPLVSRGDIARCVTYMIVAYKLDYCDPIELRILQQWMINDPPSEFEKKFNEWVSATKPLGIAQFNPFISNLKLLEDEHFDALIKSALGVDLPARPGSDDHKGSDVSSPPPAVPAESVRIDSVLPNPRGLDLAGAETVTLHCFGEKAIKLDGWRLAVTVTYPRATQTTSYDISGIDIHPRELLTLSFTENNALPNSRATKLELVAPKGNVVSTLSYSSSDIRAGRYISTL